MKGSMNTAVGARRLLVTVAIGALIGSAQAHAQASAQTGSPQTGEQLADPAQQQLPENAPASSDVPAEEIVVTGTLLRGIAPVGTNVVGVDRTQIQATGATSTNDVLARIPQISSSFNRAVVSTGTDAGTTISRPNIRNLGASGANTTLVLVDGHRIVGAGVLQTTPDPDVVAPGLIERIEIVPDGGSSIYGSDAIGGVINFITRKRFDGFEVNGRYGFADDYYQYDVNATAGRDWGTGSLYASYVFTKHDAIFGRDRDYVRQISPSTSCGPGTVTVGTVGTASAVSYALPGLAANTSNLCDISDNASIVPDEQRHTAFAGLSQDLSSGLSVDIKAFYTHRETNPYIDQFRATGTITSANPFFRPIGAATTQTVAFSYAPVFGPSNRQTTLLDEWGVTPSFTAKLGGGWQLRALGNYGRSATSIQQRNLNTSAQSAALAATGTGSALNPYDLSATNPTVLANIGNFELYGRSVQELGNGRVILDGSPISLPGGDVRLAVGAEVIWESYRVRQGNRVIGDPNLLPGGQSDRTARSVFGEVAIPIFGAENGFTGMRALTLSASARYDDYSDFGDTFNPKVGLTWKVVDGVSLRGNWGRSFNAPSLADTGAATSQVTVAPLLVLPTLLGVSVRNPAVPAASPLQSIILVAGGNRDLQPQTAETYSFGADIQPTFIPGLKLSGTYWNVRFKNQIAVAFGSNLYAPGLESFYINNPTLAQVTGRAGDAQVTGAFFNGAGIAPATSVAAVFASPVRPYLLADLRRNNLGSVNTDGLDFNAAYFLETGFGSINASATGSYILNRDVRATATSPEVDQVATDFSRLNLSGSLGAVVGGFSAQATVYRNSGFRLAIPLGAQTKVSGFNTVDLAFTYDPRLEGLAKDLMLTLNVNNVFDQDPPFINNGFGYGNGSTLGRLVQFGVRKRF